MKILICDHDRDARGETRFSRKLREQLAGQGRVIVSYEENVDIAQPQSIKAIQRYIVDKKPDLVIAHLGPTEKVFHNNCDWKGCIVYISSDGRTELHQKYDQRYDLYIRRKKDTFINWPTLVRIGLDLDECALLVEGRSSYAKEFEILSNCDVLSTVAICAQGYLATHSNLTTDLNTQEKNCLNKALTTMGWLEIRKDSQAKNLIPSIFFLNEIDEKQGRDKITQLRQSVALDSDYWKALRAKEYVTAARDEWEECVKRGNGYVSSGSDWDSSKLKKLLLAIAAANPPQKSTEICLVAEAYLEVNNCLGGV